jgi:peptide/nickel transport system ATP-binding protein
MGLRFVPLFEVDNLWVRFSTPDGVVEAVRGVSFAVERGETLGIVGESGSGKTLATQAAFGLAAGARVEGRAVFDRRDLLAMTVRDRRSILGAQVGMVFQNPLSSLHPMYKVGWQITEAIRTHDRSVSKRAAHARAVDLLGLVGIPQPARRADDYPHQFSGGMRQRAMIAMAISLGPSLLIADEPTTAVDVTIQAQILEVLRQLKDELGIAIVMITHDLGVIAELADRVVVLYGGQVMEKASVSELFYKYHHPYTRGLLRSLPAAEIERGHLVPIEGQPPSPINPPPGCPFVPRCPYRMDRCVLEPPPLEAIAGHPGHLSACFLPKDSASLGPENGHVAIEAAMGEEDRG